MRGYRVVTLVALMGLSWALVPASVASAATVAGSVIVTVNVESAQANPGSVAVVSEFDSTTYGTCQGLATPGTASCQVTVPARSPIVLWAEPASGETWKTWKNSCSGAPGVVCFLWSSSSKTATVVLGTAGRKALLTPASPYTYGNTPNCAFNQTLTVDGSGLPANTPATLTDDGAQIASGTTSSTGSLSLTYTSQASEPGFYRTLVMTAGTVSASTDVENAGVLCVSGGTGHGSVSFGVGTADDDANSFFDFTFGRNPTLQVNTDSTGAGSVTTPSYTCPTGKTITEKFSGTTGAGTTHQYHWSASAPFTCP